VDLPNILAFADYLQFELYDWQRDYLVAYDLHSDDATFKLTLRAPNDSGKTSRLAVLSALWGLVKHPAGKVVYTSKDLRQVNDQFWRAIRGQLYHFPNWKITESQHLIETPEGGFLRAFTTKDAGRVEGFHKAPGAPLLMIVDEAKSIEEEIFRGIDRCDFSVLAYISSPDEMTGRFYESFQSDQFVKFHAGLKDCTHISKERIEAIKKWYGADDPYTHSVLEGEFMNYGAGVPHIIEHGELEAWRNKTIGFLPGLRFYACDFARGGDDNVLLLREGNKVVNIWTCREKDTAKAVEWFVGLIRDNGYAKGVMVLGDASGTGGPMCDQIRRHGIAITDFNFGGKTGNPRYKNEGSRIYYTVAEMIRESKIVPPPYEQQDVKRLFSQLANRQVKREENGKLSMESKEDMRSRGVSSPDIADAFAMAFGQPPFEQRSYSPFDDSGRQEIARKHGWDYSSEQDESHADRRSWGSGGRGDDDRFGGMSGFGGCHGDW
jgi:phage terminase large subunit